MPVFKDEKTNKWYAMVRFTDWQGQHRQKCKRGFAMRRDALEWEKVFQMQTTSDMDMSFEAFVELYKAESQPRLKQTTWMTKEHIINTKILPYFGKRKISEIQSKDVIAWQNKLLLMKDEKGKPYSPVYLKTIYNQLSAIFNHAVRYYNLRSNPAAKAGNMGSEERMEMLFWTKAEYLKFAEAMMDEPLSYYLVRNTKKLLWEMESAETELWEEEPDPLLEEVAKVVSEDDPKWEGSVTALAKQIQYSASPISLAMRLNVCADRLKHDYHIKYERYRSHKGRGVRLTLEFPAINNRRSA